MVGEKPRRMEAGVAWRTGERLKDRASLSLLNFYHLGGGEYKLKNTTKGNSKEL